MFLLHIFFLSKCFYCIEKKTSKTIEREYVAGSNASSNWTVKKAVNSTPKTNCASLSMMTTKYYLQNSNSVFSVLKIRVIIIHLNSLKSQP